MSHQVIGQIAGGIATLGFIPYLIAIFRNKTKPSKASWTIWAIIGVALALSYKTSGANATMWAPISYAICPIVVLAAAYYKDRSKMTSWPKADKICLVVGLLLFVPWLLFKIAERSNMSPEWSWILPRVTLYGGIMVDALGSIPTVWKSWKNPEGEDSLAWTFYTVGNCLNLLAVETWSWDVASYAVYMTMPAVLILPSLYIYRIKRAKRP